MCLRGRAAAITRWPLVLLLLVLVLAPLVPLSGLGRVVLPPLRR